MTNNWQVKRLDEVATVTMGQSPSSTSYNDQGMGVPFFQGKPSNIDNFGVANPYQYTTEPTKVVEAGTALMTVRAPVGDIFTSPVDVCIGRGLSGIKANTDISQKYLNYQLQFASQQFHTLSQGSTFTAINSSDLKSIQIGIPNLTIQQKIGDILASIDEAIQKSDQIIQKSEELKQGLMQNILNFGSKDDVRYLALGDIGKVSMCKRIFKKETSNVGDIPFYKIGTFGKEPDAFISKELYDTYRNKYPYPKIGDVLLSASGTIGRKVKYDGKPAYFQDSNIVWLEHDESIILNNFLYYLYETINWQTEGSTIKRLYNDILLRKVVPVPPVDKQRQLLKILSAVDEKITINKKLKVRIIFLKKGLMNDIFNQKVQIN